MTIENWIISFTSTALGAGLGYFYANKLSDNRSDKLIISLFDEFELILDSLNLWLPSLIQEFEQPNQSIYSGLPPVDLSYIKALTIELAGTNNIVSKEQRKLIVRLNAVFTNLQMHHTKRDGFIEELFKSDNKIDGRLHNGITFHSAFLISDVTQIVFYILINHYKVFIMRSNSKRIVDTYIGLFAFSPNKLFIP